ncbi:nucleotidyltransferase substrate binding protein [Azohydromonas caseinilytica]|uniref:Nucleotidyltransferase n=1 Tax=Azohydromonas caseinilytica TaxID=2728836 RepID=A0A848FAD3_9BURK|nr:nucleotidyltransferase substrate binding protein [Azohydromonas caseinilytica]NML14941.1 nucleotidyltransferase [Azohydromonas caseinilytica]
MELYIEPLGRSADRLDEALRRCLLDPGDLLIRDGLVQRFELGYDLALKAIRRCLSLASDDAAAVAAMDAEALIGLAHQQRLVTADWPVWRTWHALRAHTGHDNDEPMGPDVVAAVPRFLDELRRLQKRLGGRIV